MRESLDDAKLEMKRVEHQIYVSLKYTRTVDVFLNIISRMITAYDYILDALLKQAVEKKAITEAPTAPKEKGELIKQLFDDVKIHENVELYFLLRSILKSSYAKQNEFRRHVTMIAYVNGKQELINIDIITQYYHFQREFLTYVENLLFNQ
ncbi:MAG: hypothetical protein V1743_00735 [Nanoarchaeota archaeon]